MQWQPIETAPRDGTEILAWGPTQAGSYLVVYDGLDWWTPEQYPHGWTELIEAPTHWMPLPQPPSR